MSQLCAPGIVTARKRNGARVCALALADQTDFSAFFSVGPWVGRGQKLSPIALDFFACPDRLITTSLYFHSLRLQPVLRNKPFFCLKFWCVPTLSWHVSGPYQLIVWLIGRSHLENVWLIVSHYTISFSKGTFGDYSTDVALRWNDGASERNFNFAEREMMCVFFHLPEARENSCRALCCFRVLRAWYWDHNAIRLYYWSRVATVCSSQTQHDRFPWKVYAHHAAFPWEDRKHGASHRESRKHYTKFGGKATALKGSFCPSVLGPVLIFFSLYRDEVSRRAE